MNDSMSRGAEIAGTMLVFFGIGWFLDRTFGTTPWLMVGLALLAVVGQFVKLYYVYNAQMSSLEARRKAAVTRR